MWSSIPPDSPGIFALYDPNLGSVEVVEVTGDGFTDGCYIFFFFGQEEDQYFKDYKNCLWTSVIVPSAPSLASLE